MSNPVLIIIILATLALCRRQKLRRNRQLGMAWIKSMWLQCLRVWCGVSLVPLRCQLDSLLPLFMGLGIFSARWRIHGSGERPKWVHWNCFNHLSLWCSNEPVRTLWLIYCYGALLPGTPMSGYPGIPGWGILHGYRAESEALCADGVAGSCLDNHLTAIGE